MNTRKSMKFPIFITFIAIAIVVFLFMNIKQSQVVCEMTTNFDGDIRLYEEMIATMDGKKITEMNITKIIVLPPKYASDDKYFYRIQKRLDETLEYLGESVKYTIGNDRITVKINVKKNEMILLKNISLKGTPDLEIDVNSNTKSSDVVTLSVGDNYTDGELMKRLKNNGYTCK